MRGKSAKMRPCGCTCQRTTTHGWSKRASPGEDRPLSAVRRPREMIKYIRSLFVVDGLVALLAPGLDLSPQIRKLCEDFLARDARSKILSRGAAIGFLADLSGWLSTGPGQMLRAMELIERKQARSQPRPDRGSGNREALRIRALAVGAVWLSLALAALAGRQAMAVGTIRFWGYLFLGLWGGWTIWLANLLRRLVRP